LAKRKPEITTNKGQTREDKKNKEAEAKKSELLLVTEGL